MYEKLAWNNFEKTGDIESFLEYRRLMETNLNVNNIEDVNNKIRQNIGELLNEIDKGKGDSN